jgi:hypothetical protein
MHFGECRKVNMERVREVRLAEPPSVEDVRDLLGRVEVPIPGDYHDADVGAIIQKALNDTNPFVRGAGDNLVSDQAGAPARSGPRW